MQKRKQSLLEKKKQGEGGASHRDYIDTCQMTLSKKTLIRNVPVFCFCNTSVYPSKQFNFGRHSEQNTVNEAE